VTPAVATWPELRIRLRELVLAWALFFVALLVAASVAVEAGASTDRATLLYSPLLNTAGLVSYVVLVGAALWLGSRTQDPRYALGVIRPHAIARAVGLAFLVLVSSLLASALLEPIFHGAHSQGLTPHALPSTASAHIGLALGFLTVCVAAPVAEELFFRGAGYSALRWRLGPFGTPPVTGLAWAITHGDLQLIPQLLVFGMLLGLLYEYTDSIVPGMGVHALNNTLAFIAAFAGR